MKGILHTLLWVVEFAIGLAFIVAVVLFITPWLLTYDGTRATIFGLFKGSLGGALVIEKARFSWWDGIYVEKLTYTRPIDQLTVTCDKITTPSSLWEICFGQHNLGELVIESPTATIILDKQEVIRQAVVLQSAGTPNFSSIAQLDLPKAWSNLTPHLTGQVTLCNGVMVFQGKEIDDVRLENLALDAKLSQGSDFVKFSLSGATRQADKSGSLSWSGSFGPLDDSNPTLTITGTLKKLPMLGVDQIAGLFHPSLRGVTIAAIGPDLDLDLQLALSNQRLDLTFNASSSQFNASLQTITQNGKISLSSPARFGLMLTPFLADVFLSLSPYMMGIALANSPRASLDISELEIPLTESGMNWNQLKLNALLNVINIQFATPVFFNGIAFDRLKASLKTSNLEQELDFETTTSITLGSKQALVAASGSLARPLASDRSNTMAISAKNFPVAILDKIFSSSGFLEDAVGASCDFSGALDDSGGARNGTLYFSSSSINLSNASFSMLPDGFQLTQPVHLTFSPARSFWDKHAGGIGVAKMDVGLDRISLPYADLSKLQVQGKATSTEFFYKRFSLPNPSLAFDIQSYSSMRLNLAAEGLTGYANLGFSTGKPSMTVKEPLTLALNLDPTQAANFWREFAPPPIFLEPLSLTISFKPFSTPLGQNFLNNVSIEASIATPLIKVQAPSKTTAIVKNGTSIWTLDAQPGRVTVRTSADIGCQDDTLVPLQAQLIIRKIHFQPVFNTADIEFLAKASVEKLDTQFIDAWRTQKTALSPLLGGWISFKGDILKTSDSGSFGVDATCEKGNFNAHLVKTGDMLTLDGRQAALVTMNIDQAGYKALEGLLGTQLPAELVKPAQVEFRVTQLNLPLKKSSLELDIAALPQATIESVLQTESISLVERSTKVPFSLSHLAFRFARPNITSPLILNLKTSIDAAKPGLVDFRGQLKGIHHSSKGWDLRAMHAIISANFQQLPSSVVDTFTTAVGMQPDTITTFFGDQISGKFEANIDKCNGPLSLTVNSPSTRLSLDGALENGVLLLNQPFFAQMTLTEGVSRLFLRGVNPLSISAVSSDGPLTLHVNPQGFSMPIIPWNIANANIEHARIELGKITSRNQGNISVTLGLLKLGQFSNSKDLKLWFAPMDISMRNGLVNCERTEILVADSIDIATWGDIDLVNSRVDAVLGLTAQALSKAFGIKGLPENYVLQIPMKGPIDDVKIDTSKATTKIALLLAAQKATGAGSFLKGPQGALIGGLLGGIAKLPDGDTTAPAPKHPFPWEEQPPASSKMPPKKKKSAIKPGDKPLKQLIKLLK